MRPRNAVLGTPGWLMSSWRWPRINTGRSPAERRIARPSAVRSHPDPERTTWNTAAPNDSRPRPHGAVSSARAINDPDIWMLRSATLNGSTGVVLLLNCRSVQRRLYSPRSQDQDAGTDLSSPEAWP